LIQTRKTTRKCYVVLGKNFPSAKTLITHIYYTRGLYLSMVTMARTRNTHARRSGRGSARDEVLARDLATGIFDKEDVSDRKIEPDIVAQSFLTLYELESCL